MGGIPGGLSTGAGVLLLLGDIDISRVLFGASAPGKNRAPVGMRLASEWALQEEQGGRRRPAGGRAALGGARGLGHGGWTRGGGRVVTGRGLGGGAGKGTGARGRRGIATRPGAGAARHWA